VVNEQPIVPSVHPQRKSKQGEKLLETTFYPNKMIEYYNKVLIPKAYKSYLITKSNTSHSLIQINQSLSNKMPNYSNHFIAFKKKNNF
jgi:hypothetical protein